MSKRNKNANCGNCNYCAQNYDDDAIPRCLHTERTIIKHPNSDFAQRVPSIVHKDDVCNLHPNFWGWADKMCEECGYAIEGCSVGDYYNIVCAGNGHTLLPSSSACPNFIPKPTKEDQDD